MSKVIKTIVLFDDGTFIETMPSLQNDPYFKASHCPKCNIAMESSADYVCTQYPCPAGLSTMQSLCGND